MAIDPDNRLRFDLMGFERIPHLLWFEALISRDVQCAKTLRTGSKQEDRQGRRQQIMLLATIVAALGTTAIVVFSNLF